MGDGQPVAGPAGTPAPGGKEPGPRGIPPFLGRFHQAPPSSPLHSLDSRLLSRNVKLLGAWQGRVFGGGPTHPLGQEITFLHRRRTSQVSNPSGQLISLGGRAPPSTGSETLRLGFSQARPSEGKGGTALTGRPGLRWQEAPARARGCSRVGSRLSRQGWDEVLWEQRCRPALPITSRHPGLG